MIDPSPRNIRCIDYFVPIGNATGILTDTSTAYLNFLTAIRTYVTPLPLVGERQHFADPSGRNTRVMNTVEAPVEQSWHV